MDERERHKRIQRSDTIWTFAIIAAFLIFWPVGVLLAVLKSKKALPDIGMGTPTASDNNWRSVQTEQERNFAKDWEQELHRQTEHAKEQTRQWSERIRQQAQNTAKTQTKTAVPFAVPVQQKTETPKKKKLQFGKPMFITGTVIGTLGLLALSGNLLDVSSFGGFLRTCTFPLGLVGVGLYLVVTGIRRIRQSKRMQEYVQLLPDNGTGYDLQALAERTGRPYRQVLADLQRMVELGVWNRAWLDRKGGWLRFTPYTEEPKPKPEPKPTANEDARAEQVLRRIRDANDRIADEAISAKIDRIGLLTGEIFGYVNAHPEREGELRTFMDYYLPQTLKILETYAKLEAQGVETDNIRKAKREISGMLDQLTSSYERQLDKLFDSDVVDISADIEVMKQMLRSDGLTADELELLAKEKRS